MSVIHYSAYEIAIVAARFIDVRDIDQTFKDLMEFEHLSVCNTLESNERYNENTKHYTADEIREHIFHHTIKTEKNKSRKLISRIKYNSRMDDRANKFLLRVATKFLYEDNQ